MGLFDFMKSKPKGTGSQKDNLFSELSEAQQERLLPAMREIAKQMFPNGYADVERGGKDISKIISGKLSEEKCRALLGAVKYLLLSAGDKSRERIISSILMRGEGKITDHEAALIYRYLIDGDPVVRAAKEKNER